MNIQEHTKKFDLTILLPALNEEESLGKIIDEINSSLENSKINYCILVSDNGSKDKTIEICKQKKVLINEVSEKGYGSNLKDAIKKIKSKYFIFFDCDGSYNPSEIKKMYEKIEKEDLDMVYGNRLKKQERDSMPFLHRFLGTPVLSFFIRLFFKNGVYDCNSGMRILKTKSFEDIKFFCKGMEFASEIFIKSSLNKLKIDEVVINFRKDFRSREPHLSRWKDGWRHLRYILANAPDFYINFILFLVGFNYLLIFILSWQDVGNDFPRYHTIFALLALNQFFKSLFLGIISLRISLVKIEDFKSRIIDNIFKLKLSNFFMKVFVILFSIAFIELIFVTYSWYENLFTDINEISTMIRILIYSAIGSFSMYFDLQMQSREDE